MKDFSLHLGEPVVVTQAEPGVDKWGQWQFPVKLSRLMDGRLGLIYSVGQDSAAGGAEAHAISEDEGNSWIEVDQFPSPDGVELANGERLRIKPLLGMDAAWVDLPAYDRRWYSGVVEYDFYREQDIPEALRSFRLERYHPQTQKWTLEHHHVSTPGAYMAVTRDDMTCHPFGTEGDFLNPKTAHRLRVAPDGKVWMLTYQNMKRKGEPYYSSTFFVSEDDGKNFTYRSHVAFDESFEIPEDQRPQKGTFYEGFCEPDIAFMPDGSIICIMRSGNSTLPSYIMRSEDEGHSWTRPEVFDAVGVMPGLASLKCGVTVAIFGRPGVYLKATGDPHGIEWSERLTVLPHHQPTCANCGILALNEDTALITYSNFRYPNAKGELVKTILAQKVCVKVG